MFEDHPLDLEGTAVFGCAQAGCRVCQEALLLRHEGLVHFFLHRQARDGVAYDDLAQEGRIALWRAVLGFDAQRGVAFSTYAGVAIKRQIWQAVARARRHRRGLPPTEQADPLEALEETWQQAEVRSALLEAASRLPARLREIIIARYGLDGQPPCTLAALGRRFGLTKARIGQLHNDALVLLRLLAFSGRLRRVCGQDSRKAYARTEALSRVWLQRKRGRRR